MENNKNNISAMEYLGQHLSTNWNDASDGQLSHQGYGDDVLFKKEGNETHFYSLFGKYIATLSKIETISVLELGYEESFDEEIYVFYKENIIKILNVR